MVMYANEVEQRKNKNYNIHSTTFLKSYLIHFFSSYLNLLELRLVLTKNCSYFSIMLKIICVLNLKCSSKIYQSIKC